MSWWDDAVNTVTSLQSYKQIVVTLFVDGIINWGRLVVLKEFTKDVCHHHPDIATEVCSHYNVICSSLCHQLASEHREKWISSIR